MTTGASNDLQQVRSIARRMVTQWGSSKNKLGAISWEDPNGQSAVGPQAASAPTEILIDDEVKELVTKAYVLCKDTLTKNRKLLDDLTQALIEKETVDFNQLSDMVAVDHPELAAAQKAMVAETMS